MLNNMIFRLFYLLIQLKAVPLQCVFHSIRFKVNKRLEQGVAPFFMPVRFLKPSKSVNPTPKTLKIC